MRLPNGPEDGALPLDHVKSVLRDQGIRVVDVDGWTILQKDTILRTLKFKDPVYREVLQGLWRTFGFDYVEFYKPRAV